MKSKKNLGHVLWGCLLLSFRYDILCDLFFCIFLFLPEYLKIPQNAILKILFNMIWDHKDNFVAVWSAIIDAVDSTYSINQFLE